MIRILLAIVFILNTMSIILGILFITVDQIQNVKIGLGLLIFSFVTTPLLFYFLMRVLKSKTAELKNEQAALYDQIKKAGGMTPDHFAAKHKTK